MHRTSPHQDRNLLVRHNPALLRTLQGRCFPPLHLPARERVMSCGSFLNTSSGRSAVRSPAGKLSAHPIRYTG